MSLYEEKKQLYNEYLDALREINGGPLDSDPISADEVADYYINNEHSSWLNVWNTENELCGFVIVSKHTEDDDGECHPDTDYFVSQAYVKPEAREKGYMRQVFVDYALKHPGKYAMILLNSNKSAEDVWDHIFYGYLCADQLPLRLIPGALGENEHQKGYIVR